MGSKQDQHKLIDITLRIIKNELIQGLLKPSDLDTSIISHLENVMSTRARIVIVAQIISLLCLNESKFRLEIASKKDTLLNIFTFQVVNDS